jgi:hypothetical protein
MGKFTPEQSEEILRAFIALERIDKIKKIFKL